MSLIDKYVDYIRNVRRYSIRTVDLYSAALYSFVRLELESEEVSDDELVASLNRSQIRSFEMKQMGMGKSARTVCLYMSALSGFCNYLMKNDILKSNPVKLVAKPKVKKRLPVYYRRESMHRYFDTTKYIFEHESFNAFISGYETKSGKDIYERMLARLIISILYSLGIRRAELIGLTIEDVDFGRKIVKVRGKGDKMREIPLIDVLCEEILLYLKAVEAMCCGERSLKEPLLVTYRGGKLYPAYVDRTVKGELGGIKGITGRKSPHVLRHTLATELLNGDVPVHSIKEMLGHSSLAATQVYTHGSISRLKTIYESAHPRAKNGGKNGD